MMEKGLLKEGVFVTRERYEEMVWSVSRTEGGTRELNVN